MSVQISNIPIYCAIVEFLAKDYPELEINTRHHNDIIKAADSIVKSLRVSTVKAEADMGLSAWLSSDGTGDSSKYMASILSSGEAGSFPYAIPYDPSDYQRCRELLESVPEFKNNFHLMANTSSVWKGLVEDWEQIADLLDSGDNVAAWELLKKNHSLGYGQERNS